MPADSPDFTVKPDIVLDLTSLACPMPLLKTRQQLRGLEAGVVLLVRASDPGAMRDIPAWLRQTRHSLVQSGEHDGVLHFLIRAGEAG